MTMAVVPVIVTGSMPEYVMTSVPRPIVPDCAPVIVDVTAVPLPAISTVSNPPCPPSTVPAKKPFGPKTNVSSFPAAPSKFSIPISVTLPAVPVSLPVMFHVSVDGGPRMRSAPPPPSIRIGRVSSGTPRPSSNASAWSLPTIASSSTDESARLSVTPPTVTPSRPPMSEIVSWDPSVSVISHVVAAAAGDESASAVGVVGPAGTEGVAPAASVSAVSPSASLSRPSA